MPLRAVLSAPSPTSTSSVTPHSGAHTAAGLPWGEWSWSTIAALAVAVAATFFACLQWRQGVVAKRESVQREKLAALQREEDARREAEREARTVKTDAYRGLHKLTQYRLALRKYDNQWWEMVDAEGNRVERHPPQFPFSEDGVGDLNFDAPRVVSQAVLDAWWVASHAHTAWKNIADQRDQTIRNNEIYVQAGNLAAVKGRAEMMALKADQDRMAKRADQADADLLRLIETELRIGGPSPTS